MRVAWHVAALAAGSLAAPSDKAKRWEGLTGGGGGPPRGDGGPPNWGGGSHGHGGGPPGHGGAPPTLAEVEARRGGGSSTPAYVATVTDVYTTVTTTVGPSSTPTCSVETQGSLTNEEQVGDSTWGTLCQPYLPQWLGDYETAPWGDCTASTCDATVKKEVPVTNVTRYYEFVISRGRISADGVLRDVILVNNQFPGPLIEANWGDWIQVNVTNNITDPLEGTTMHWHGQLQRDTPWMDGTPAGSQCPIAPGHSFTYYYQAEEHGTSWYHSHFSAQFTAGVVGPMIVYGPTTRPYDIDLGPVMLSDWYHIPYFAIVGDAVGTNYSLIPPISDSVLINGRGSYNCSDPSYNQGNDDISVGVDSNITYTCVNDAPLSKFRFQSRKTHRIRLINHGANGVQKFSIDHHNLTVIAVDYVPVKPYDTDVATLGVGQRMDVLVTALDRVPDASIWMRASAPGGQTCGGSANPETKAAIYYEDADTSIWPTSESSVTDTSCRDDDLYITEPAYPLTPEKTAFVQDLALNLVLNETGHFEFQINDQAWHVDFNVPLLPQAAAGNYSWEPQWNVYDFGANDSVIFNVSNNMPLFHPFHMHGHNFWILQVDGPLNFDEFASQGTATGPVFADSIKWNGTVANPNNPLRRDSVLIPPYGYAAIQIRLDNPGIWPFHCHIAWHLSGGQGMNILYGADNITTLPDGVIDDTCVDWDYFSSHNIVNEIGSGS